ncbi:MAG: hypothetical protein IKJ55_06920, partial [Clostridia bacterium]|nr:hypothetical protein [Clostridia bacterium]
ESGERTNAGVRLIINMGQKAYETEMKKTKLNTSASSVSSYLIINTGSRDVPDSKKTRVITSVSTHEAPAENKEEKDVSAFFSAPDSL